MKRLAKSVRYFLLALQFFTRIPVTGRLGKWVDYSPEALRKSSAYFPAIGWIVGAVTAFTYWIIAFNLPDLPATPLVAYNFSPCLVPITLTSLSALHNCLSASAKSPIVPAGALLTKRSP